MAGLLSVALAGAVVLALVAPNVHVRDDAAATRPAAAGSSAPLAAPTVAGGPVDVTAVDPAAGVKANGEVLRVARNRGGETAIVALADRRVGPRLSAPEWEMAFTPSDVLHLEHVGAATALPAAVVTFGAIIAGFGLSPYRRTV
jgi:hypothetical protein